MVEFTSLGINPNCEKSYRRFGRKHSEGNAWQGPLEKWSIGAQRTITIGCFDLKKIWTKLNKRQNDIIAM